MTACGSATPERGAGATPSPGSSSRISTVTQLPERPLPQRSSPDAGVSPAPLHRTTAPTTPVTFEACARTAPPGGTTDLQPGRITDAMSHGVLGDLEDVPSGTITLEYAGKLHLTRGSLGAGSGFDAATATATATVQAVGAKGVDAPVTLSVLTNPRSGRLVGFVEVRLPGGQPVRWADIPSLGIGTDGGDGGFFAGGAPTLDPTDDTALDGYLEAFFPHQNSASGNVCVVRRAVPSPDIDGVLFSTGYGDGGYPTFGGYAADGRLVSLVSYGFVVPWRLSGLPGSPPKDVVDEERKLAARS